MSRIDPIPASNYPAPQLVFVGKEGFSWHGADKHEILANRNPYFDIDVIG